MTSLIWWARCCHPYLWLQFPILISTLNVWLSISIFKINIDKAASQNQNSTFKIELWVVNIKIQIQDSKVGHQDWHSISTFASLLGNIQYQNQNHSYTKFNINFKNIVNININWSVHDKFCLLRQSQKTNLVVDHKVSHKRESLIKWQD